MLILPKSRLIPLKALSSRRSLDTLKRINKIIRVRLCLHDIVPPQFSAYLVHDGRVTFASQHEFEVDLSVAQDGFSQYYYLGARFLFSPSPSVPVDLLFPGIDRYVNSALNESGLSGCLELLHGFTLATKITLLHKQAIELLRASWADDLRVELLHRTLVVQYWVRNQASKNWIEIGVRHRPGNLSFLHLRWIRDNTQVDTSRVNFNVENLSVESILNSIMALQMSDIFLATYFELQNAHSSDSLHVNFSTSQVEPADCYLEVKLSETRITRIIIEPISGSVVIRTIPSIFNWPDHDHTPVNSKPKELCHSILSLQRASLKDELKIVLHTLGWDCVNMSGFDYDDTRSLFPSGCRLDVYRQKSWEGSWAVAHVSETNVDTWWVFKFREAMPSRNFLKMSLQYTALVSDQFTLNRGHEYMNYSLLVNALSGIVTIHANLRYISHLGGINVLSSKPTMTLGPNLQVPNIIMSFSSERLPLYLRVFPSVVLSGKPVLDESICLSFIDFNPLLQRVFLVARGRLSFSLKGILASSLSENCIANFQEDGKTFTICLSSRVGQPVILELLYRLQILENAVATVRHLWLKSFSPLLVSFFCIEFSYGRYNNPTASIKLSYHPKTFTSYEVHTSVSGNFPLSMLKLSIHFNPFSPDRRIKQPLMGILNRYSMNDGGLRSMIRLLSVTRYLYQAFDEISNDTTMGLAQIHIIARNAKLYQLLYPSIGYKFQFILSQKRDSMSWMLRNVTALTQRSYHQNLEIGLQEKIYNTHASGWKGIISGAIATDKAIGHLIFHLHKLIYTYISQLPPSGLHYRGFQSKQDILKYNIVEKKSQANIIMIDD